MHRFFILLLIVVMPLKALAASYGICSQDARAHGQQHHGQAGQTAQLLHAAHGLHEHETLKIQTVNNDCNGCNLCHTACGTFVLLAGDRLPLPSITSEALPVDLAVSLKARPSDPPYRPKWLALAELASVLVVS